MATTSFTRTAAPASPAPAASILHPDDDGTITVSFLLLPEYAMVSLLSAIEPLRIANRLAGRELYRWQCLSENGQAVTASNQMALQQHLDMRTVEPRNLFVNASFHPERHRSPALIDWLRRLHRRNSLLGALDTGCHLLARAGLLKGHRVTLHWEAIPAFQETYPDILISPELFEIGRNRITCAGGNAATDLMLHLIQQHAGTALALQICDQCLKNGMRPASDSQRIGLPRQFNIHHPRLIRVLTLMEQQLETPLTPAQLARSAHISLRQLERLCQQFLGVSPSAYYLKLRLERARQLLCESDLGIAEVGIACGFVTASHFCRSYRRHFDMTPGEQRRVGWVSPAGA
ncbi:GlxA family transcriptional regulator [Marinobacterium rhizophilum]|uniref:GlxA family transcriptional regulator n=1 Tax=Marinobacterium rhizophilum TaxID=420402 RepID=A0ABY5HGI5_9GAMM|nr:GlxA family transcriptional regulator [Marinobacterium rhizophilum]UTW10942.1 GlxA family transcriptional regulator [Marinobacterium rhizophilum]